MNRTLPLLLLLLALPAVAEEAAPSLGERYHDVEAECTFRPPKDWERKKPRRLPGIVYVGPQRGEIVLRFGYSLAPAPRGSVSGEAAKLGDVEARRLANRIRLAKSVVLREEYRVVRKRDMLLVWFERPDDAEDVAKLYEAVRESWLDWPTRVETTRFSFRLPGPAWTIGWEIPKAYEALGLSEPEEVSGVVRAFVSHRERPATIRMLHITTAPDSKTTLPMLRDQYVKTVAGDRAIVDTGAERERPVDGEKALVTPWRIEAEADGKKTVASRGYVAVIRRGLDFFVLVAADHAAKLDEGELQTALDAVLDSAKLRSAFTDGR